MSAISACRGSKAKAGSRRCNRYRNEKLDPVKLLKRFTAPLRVTLRLAVALAVVMGLSLALLVAHRWMTVSPYFGLKSIDISGNRQLSHAAVQRLAGVALGENSLNLNMRLIEQRIRSDPWVHSVAVRRVLPNRMVIQVNEKEPAFWVRRDGQLWYATADGDIIAPVQIERFLSLPLLVQGDGASIRQDVLGTLRGNLEARRLPFSLAEVDWIRFVSDELLELYLGGRGLSLLMPASTLNSTLGNLEPVWRDLEERRELERVKVIRLAGDKAWVRLETPPSGGRE